MKIIDFDMFKNEVGIVKLADLKEFLSNEVNPIAREMEELILIYINGTDRFSACSASESILNDFVSTYPQYHCSSVIMRSNSRYETVNKLLEGSISFYLCNGNADPTICLIEDLDS